MLVRGKGGAKRQAAYFDLGFIMGLSYILNIM
jgi:hypothetical protein